MTVAARAELRTRIVPVFRGIFTSAARAEVEAARRALDGGKEAVGRWAREFYPEHERDLIRRLGPAVASHGERIADLALQEVSSSADFDAGGLARDYTRGAASRWARASIAQVEELREGEDFEEEFRARLEGWEESRPAWTAEREATQSGGAFAKLAFLAAGTRRLVWRAGGESCPLCTRMDGRVVEITRPFLEEGAELEAERDGEPVRMVTEQRIGHPPLHGMGGKGGVCDCGVGPG